MHGTDAAQRASLPIQVSNLTTVGTPGNGLALRLRVPVGRLTLALGSDLKNTICTVRGSCARMSGVHGDLSEPDNFRAFVRAIEREHGRPRRFRGDLETPWAIAHDLHPAFISSCYARRLDGVPVAVQHHHAHGVSCAADAGASLPVLAIVCDGTGYGTDGAIWGGEVLLCRADSFTRVAHLEYFALPGGDAAVLAPWRTAMSLLKEAGCEGRIIRELLAFDGVDRGRQDFVARQLESGVNSPPTSSLGRLFDGVSFLLGLATGETRDGQAALRLQQLAESVSGPRGRGVEPFPFESARRADGSMRLYWRPMVRAILDDLRSDVPAATLAMRFHRTVADLFAGAAADAAREWGTRNVALSGGCFANPLLRGLMADRLRLLGCSALVHRRVPCGDAGLSLGQAIVAAATFSSQAKPSQE